VQLDPNQTWVLTEQRAQAETDPRRKANLEIVVKHMKADARCDIDAVLATLTNAPKYKWHGEPDDVTLNPEGVAAVAEFYDMAIVRAGAHRLEWIVDRVIADDDAVFTEGVMRLAYPGDHTEVGIEVDDPEAYYLSEARTAVVWPIDRETGLIIGEEIYKSTDEMAGIQGRKITLDQIAPLENAA
jgi:hypothetical protein